MNKTQKHKEGSVLAEENIYNKPSLQVDEPIDVAPSTESSPVLERNVQRVEKVSTIFCMAGIVISCVISGPWFRCVIGGLCLLALQAPSVLKGIHDRHRLSQRKIVEFLKKKGISPVINGNEVYWESDGKMNTVRIANGCQLQVYREYPLKEVILDKFECAASITMDEVFSAKIGARRPEGDEGKIYFSTEFFCMSMKDIMRLLPASVNILDTAEDRQRINLSNILCTENKPKKKIGFTHGYL